MLERVVEWLRDRKVFVRRRKSDRTRALAVLLCYAGVGVIPASRILSGLEKVSREATRKWFHRFKEVLPKPERKVRRAIAMDETKLKIENVQWYAWSAIDLDDGEVLAVHLSRGRSCMDTLIFLKKVSTTCKNRPLVYVDHGPWYPWSLKRYGFPYEQVTWGNRNPIEGWFSVLKSRTKRFWNRFPHGSSWRSAISWLTTFMLMYNAWRS